MAADSPIYNELNKSWKTTCRILLGDEIGELKDFEGWLKEYHPNIVKKKSYISDKDVTFARPEYCKGARFISLDEVREKAIEPLTINDVKDIDSVVEAVSERIEYVGNKVLGNSSHVESSDNVIDSQYVMDSANIQHSSNVFSSFYATEGSKHVFGGNWVGKSEFIVKSAGYNCGRLWETSFMDGSSDAYFSYCCLNCSDIMFSFSQRNKRNMIGNLQLTKDRYLELKGKLLSEIREDMKRDKTFPSMYEMVKGQKPNAQLSLPKKTVKEDMGPIESAFSSTFKVLFKKEIKGIQEYRDWLSRHFIKTDEITTIFGTKTYRTDVSIGECRVYPDDRIVTQDESLELAKLHLDGSEINSMDGIRANLGRIAFFAGDFTERADNAIRCAIGFHVSNIYDTADGNFADYCGVNMSLIRCKYAFGSNRLSDSEFCIDCYHSFNLKRCFELDNCRNCSDSYFAHNCEGLADTMFCFNAKSKRYAIGNNEMIKEKYTPLKDELVQQMADEILRNKELKWDIYNIGCAKR